MIVLLNKRQEAPNESQRHSNFRRPIAEEKLVDVNVATHLR